MRTLTISIVVCIIQSTSALTCFVSQQSSTVMVGIETKKVETKRGCEYACEQNPACTSFAHSSTNGICVLHGLQSLSLPDCSTPVTYTRWVKTTSGCPTRSIPEAEMGVDECIDQKSPGSISIAFPYCPRRNPDGSEGEVYVIRAITEDGSRVTFENDRDSSLTFDATSNMWVFTHEFGVTVKLVALACAEVDSSTCPCPTLTAPSDGTTCLSSVFTEQNGACTAPTLRYTQGASPTTRPGNEQAARVMCKAGLWLFANLNGIPNTKALTTACCAAS